MQILLAMDGSSDACVAAKKLANLNLSKDDLITVFSVDDRSGDMDFDTNFKLALDRLSGTKARIETQTSEGFAAEEILDKCHELSVDLLVVGATGTLHRPRTLIGRDAARLLWNAPCSVLISRPKSESIRKIILAYDGTGPSKSAAQMVMNFPFAPETLTQLVSVLSPPNPRFPHREPEFLQNGVRETKVIEDISLIKASYLSAGRHVETHTMRGKPDTCLINYARTEDADLMVLGYYSTSLHVRVLRFFLGSLSERIARYVPCSILLPRNLIQK